jgi:asparagine synthase (glutamine-hydrolysing)
MCGIAGFADFKDDISSEKLIIDKMTDTLKKRGPDAYGFYYSKHVLLGHRRLVVVDPAGGAQPMIKDIGGSKYVIVYNGELYNTEEIRKELLKEGYTFNAYSDTEVLLTSYIHWGPDCLKHINGIYAFAVWDERNSHIFLARDPLGVKPLFYTVIKNMLIFGSEIKTLLSHPYVEPVLTKDGITELFALGPARALGSGIFKNIKEIPPAYYMLYSEDFMIIKEYWKPECQPFNENLDTAVEHTGSLFLDAVKRQLAADVPVCTFLSGGLDSSAISAIAAEEFRKSGRNLHTYSIDYEDNSLYFKANEFQPDSDADWVGKMSAFTGSSHHNIIIRQEELCSTLADAVNASDLPGMADVDSSLFLFCRKVRKGAVVALSGECADELFGGYPWYTKPEYIYSSTFPWSGSLDQRKQILSEPLKGLDLEGFTDAQYKKTLAEVPHEDSESPLDFRMREMFYLNIKWFMLTLLNRKDRMSMSNSLEVRVPFADYRLVEYAFNLPSEFKFCDNREKGILRRALKGVLPEDVIQRKKSPYPKTHNPIYTKLVQDRMRKILADSKSPVLQLIDKEVVGKIVDTAGTYFKKPWYGQLMTGPQLIAYLIQINEWLKAYNVKIEL